MISTEFREMSENGIPWPPGVWEKFCGIPWNFWSEQNSMDSHGIPRNLAYIA